MKAWPTKKLGEVCDIYQPKTITSEQIKKEGLYKVFGANGVIGYYDKYNHEDSEVLVTCRGATCGTINLSEPKSWVTGNAMVVHPKVNDLSKMFLYYALKNSDLKFTVTGAAQPQITRTSLYPFRIPFSSLHIQHQIVERLDAIKKALELNNKQIALADELFQSLLEKELSLNNKNWKIKKLSDLVSVRGGKRVPKGRRLLDSKTAYPYIRVIDFKDFSVDTRDIKYIDQKTHEIIKNYAVEGNDIYVSIAGTTGLVGLIPEELNGANLTENAVKLVLKDANVDRKFLTFFLSSNFGQNQLKRNTYAPGVPKLAIYRLENTKIPLPPLKTQCQIVGKLRAAQDYKKKLLEQRTKLKELFDSVLHKEMKGV